MENIMLVNYKKIEDIVIDNLEICEERDKKEIFLLIKEI